MSRSQGPNGEQTDTRQTYTIEDADNGYTARDDTKLPQGTIQKKVQSSLKTIILNDMMAIYGFSTHQGVAIIYG